MRADVFLGDVAHCAISSMWTAEKRQTYRRLERFKGENNVRRELLSSLELQGTGPQEGPLGDHHGTTSGKATVPD